MRGSKIPVQELWLKMGGGRIREGGVIAGFYGTCVSRLPQSCYIMLLSSAPSSSLHVLSLTISDP